ncbi:MDR family MFS transporter [Anoxybacteroides amylolyticum]|uniref:Sugar (And other) transporter family protein n=1 Tax=Anoxybacteroides amylolyticum TaxID=294699 RepID=A0A160F3J9_9BACL|nr:MFS transporter [Anoxybacillus amylolyticus]ANB60917.1 sugar (and other) transporter family protein [Anoxybacillus amylolyticus]
MWKKLNRISLHIIIGTFFARAATFMTIPFLSIYLTKVKGVSAVEAGMIIGISSFVSIFSGFIGGYLSDRFGRKNVMISSIWLWSLVFIGFAVANDVWLFFLLNALHGICRSFFEPSSRALLSDVTKQEHKLLVFNLRYAAINVAAAIGPLLGLKMGSASSTLAFWLTAFIYGLYGVSLWWLSQREVVSSQPKETRVTFRKACTVIVHDKIFLLGMIGITLGVAGYSQFSSTIPQYVSSYTDGVQLFSYLIVVNAITVLIAQYPITRIGKMYSPAVSIALGTITSGIGLWLFGLFHHPLLLVTAMVVFTIGEVMMFTMTDLFVDQIAKPQMKGLYFGAMGFTSIGNAFGPVVGGFLLSFFGMSRGGYLFASLALLSFLGFPFLFYVAYLIKEKKQTVEYSA